MSEWQPIDSSPRTGRARLVWCPQILCIYEVCWDSERQDWAVFGGNGTCLDRNFALTPTHWMPLPEPPK